MLCSLRSWKCSLSACPAEPHLEPEKVGSKEGYRWVNWRQYPPFFLSHSNLLRKHNYIPCVWICKIQNTCTIVQHNANDTTMYCNQECDKALKANSVRPFCLWSSCNSNDTSFNFVCLYFVVPPDKICMLYILSSSIRDTTWQKYRDLFPGPETTIYFCDTQNTPQIMHMLRVCFLVTLHFISNSCDAFTHIAQGCFIGKRKIVGLSLCLWRILIQWLTSNGKPRAKHKLYINCLRYTAMP